MLCKTFVRRKHCGFMVLILGLKGCFTCLRVTKSSLSSDGVHRLARLKTVDAQALATPLMRRGEEGGGEGERDGMSPVNKGGGCIMQYYNVIIQYAMRQCHLLLAAEGDERRGGGGGLITTHDRFKLSCI